MSYYRWLVVALVLCLTGAAVADEGAGEGAQVFPYQIHTETLDNGLKTILVPMSSEGLVAYWTIVRTGSRDEYEPGRSGFAHFFEHMMFRGTEKFPQDVYNRITTEMGADTNAYTTDDLTAYHLAISAEDLPRVMEIESDRFQRLDYPVAAFKTEAGAVYGEYRKNKMNPFFSAFEKIQETAFKKHTYGHTTMGYERDIKNMPNMYDYSRTFFDRYYRPENCVLLIVGDISIDETMANVRKFYGDWEPGYVAPKIQPEPPQTEERRVSVDYPGRSLPIVWLGYKVDAFDPSDKTRVAADLLAELAFGSTSALNKRLVLDEQVVEFLAASAGMNRDANLFDVYTRIKDPAKVDYVIGEIDKTIERYQNEPADPVRIEALKSRLRYQFLMRLDTPDNVASSLARLVAVTGGLDAIEEYYNTVAALTAEDVQAAAETYLQKNRRTVATLRGQS